MYAVAYFHSTGEPRQGVFPNVFPDYDMACDAVIYAIKDEYGDVVSLLTPSSKLGGQTTFHWEDTIYVVGKLFNFNPKGM